MAPVSFSEPPPDQKPPEKIVPEDHGTIEIKESAQVSKSPSQLPTVVLDVDRITDTVAARLATTLLGHVLFLKNQIPLPIVQLARISGGTNTKVAKLKADLLSSYDTLASHLVTTFSALSTALAQCNSTTDQTVNRVYLAILIGPNLGTAKSKVIYAVDTFATRIWGRRDDPPSEEDHWSGEEFPEVSEDEDSGGSTNSELTGSHENIADNTVDDFEPDNDGESGENEGSEEDENSVEVEVVREEISPKLQHQSYADEQRFLQAADRLLSRVLTSADAEGHPIANEMSPSQTHILIRAPRRFVHPVWVPRQNITKQMEAILINFLEESWPSMNSARVGTKKKRVEGVWVTAKNGLGQAPQLHKGDVTDEDDELIWWSWEGKLVGFSDW